jgi:hypothetical protein
MKRTSIVTGLVPPQCESGTTHNIYVVETYAIGSAARRGIQHYEIQIAPEPDPEAPRVSLITTDVEIYKRAHAAEDRDRQFDVIWHRIETSFGIRYLIERFEERR